MENSLNLLEARNLKSQKNMKKLEYIKNGNICEPQIQSGVNIIIHCCNDIPVMGSGVAKALYTQWPQVKEQYLLWHKMTEEGFHTDEELGIDNHSDKYQYHFPDPDKRNFALGNVQLISVETGIEIGVSNALVGNIIGQHNIYPNKVGMPPVRYSAIDYACGLIAKNASESELGFTIHVPYLMGCDLAGGKWDIIERILLDNFKNNGISCLAYDLFGKYPDY